MLPEAVRKRKEEAEALLAEMTKEESQEQQEPESLEQAETPDPTPEPVAQQPSEDWEKRFKSLKDYHDRTVAEDRRAKQAAEREAQEMKSQVQKLTDQIADLKAQGDRTRVDTHGLSAEFGEDHELVKTINSLTELNDKLQDRINKLERMVTDKSTKVEELASTVQNVGRNYDNLTHEQFVNSVFAKGEMKEVPIREYAVSDEFNAWIDNNSPEGSPFTYRELLEQNKSSRNVDKTLSIFSVFHRHKTGSVPKPKTFPNRSVTGQGETPPKEKPITQEEYDLYKSTPYRLNNAKEWAQLSERINAAMRNGTLPQTLR